MKALLLLGCSQAKRPDAGLLPALDRYDGPAYRVVRRVLRERPGLVDQLTILVLSAEYGIIPASQLIHDYDRRMTWERVGELRVSAQPVVEQHLRDHDVCCVNLGADYWPVVSRAFTPGKRPTSLRLTKCEGSIGLRLKQLVTWFGLLEEARVV